MAPPDKTVLKKDASVNVSIPVRLRPGYHVNSNTPSDQFLIPLKLTLTSNSVQVSPIEYPTPQMMKLSFSEKPVSVYEGDFILETKFKASPGAAGYVQVDGKLRYQACNDKMCLPPRSIDFKIPVDIREK